MSYRTKWMLIVGAFVALAFLPYAFKRDRGACVETTTVKTTEMTSMIGKVPFMGEVTRTTCARWEFPEGRP
jgi:hypothetical protein